MKRLLLFIAVSIFMASAVNAQEEVILLSHKTLVKKAASSDEQILDAKKSAKSSTWSKRGKLYQDVFNQGLEQLTLGMGSTSMKIFYGDPISTTEVDSNNVIVFNYETINYYVEDDKLRGWTRNNPITEKPLEEALKAYQKAVKLTDEEKQLKLQEKLEKNLIDLKDQFKSLGQCNYFFEEYEDALNNFSAILEINQLPIFEGVVDTMMINFSGIVAREVGRTNKDNDMTRKAISYYKQLTELEYGGINTFIQMTRDYYSIGDTLAAIENLKRGLVQYPDSSMLVTLAAQAYYLMHENEAGIEFTNERIEATPMCGEAYYWKALLITNHDNLSQDTIDMSLDLYAKGVEVDPTNAPIWYQAGYVYYAVGANFFEQESYEADPDFRQELIDKGNDNYEKAVFRLEKTYDLTEDDLSIRTETLDLLKRVYYKLYGNEDERYLSTMERIKNL